MRQSFWKLLAVLIVLSTLFSPFGFEFILFVDAIGFEMFTLLVEVQILVIASQYKEKIEKLLETFNTFLMERDPNYFVSDCKILRSYPPMIIHALPTKILAPLLVAAIIARGVYLL